MRSRTGAAIRRRRRALAIGASGVVHVALIGAFVLQRGDDTVQAEGPTITVELVRIGSSLRQAPTPAPPKPAIGRPTVATAPTTVAPRYVQPEATVGPGRSGRDGVDLNGPVFADGQWPRPGAALRTRCDPAKDPARLSPACRREDDLARAVTAANDAQYGRGEFAREARRKDAIKRYRDGTGETPTMPCMVFNLC